MRKYPRSLCFVMAVLLCTAASAQKYVGAGIFNSPKGFGFSVQVSGQREHFSDFQLYADIYGVISGKERVPGIKLAYDYCTLLNDVEFDDFTMYFFAGPGVTVGYARDYNFEKGLGLVFAVNGQAGILFDFKRKPICLDLSWTLEAGMHLRSNEKLGIGQLSFYNNGAYRAVLPQLSIEYYF